MEFTLSAELRIYFYYPQGRAWADVLYFVVALIAEGDDRHVWNSFKEVFRLDDHKSDI